jgi:rhodanese-related sulfurtransferase
VAQQLQQLGIDAAALEGGFDAWRSRFAVEPVSAAA